MPDAIYLDFECLKTKPPTPMLLGLLADVAGRRRIQQLIVSAALARVPAGRRRVRHAAMEAAVRVLVEQAEGCDCPIVGWSTFDRDVIARADIPVSLKTAVARRYVNALDEARPWKTLVYPKIKIARVDANAAKNTLDKFAALAGYPHVAALRAGEPATWIRRVIKDGAPSQWRALLDYNAHDLQALRAIWLRASSELATWRSYTRGNYCVDPDRGKTFCFKAGATNARLDALLERHGVKTWAFITAWNPAARGQTPETNDAAQATLMASVTVMGHPWFTGRGRSDDGSWPHEESLLILGIAERKARWLGRRFGQSAILVGRAGRPARLVSSAAPRLSP